MDDLALVVTATNYVLKRYDKPLMDRDQFRRSFQLPYAHFYQTQLPGVPMDDIEACFREGFAAASDPVPVLDHAEEFLQFLQQRGDRMFVLTSMCAVAFAEQSEELKLASYFERTYAGVLDKRQRIGEIVERHELDVAGTVFVGDMMHDVETAHHGGLRSVGVLTGYNHREVLQTVQPSLLVNDLKEFRQTLTLENDWDQLFKQQEELV